MEANMTGFFGIIQFHFSLGFRLIRYGIKIKIGHVCAGQAPKIHKSSRGISKYLNNSGGKKYPEKTLHYK